MCNLAWNPVWRAVAKDARIRQPGVVLAIFQALEAEGAAAVRLTPAILSAGLGFRPATIERVMASLASHGVTCDGVVTPQWRLAGRPEAGLSQKPSAIRMRAKRLRDREAAESRPEADRSPAVTGDAPSLEEREQDQLFPSGAREPIRSARGWGVQAEADKQAKRQKWLSNVTEYAKPHLAASDWARLCEAAVQDEVPRWAQAELDEWSRRMKADKERPPPRRPDPQQPEMLMPIASKPALLTGIRGDWNERMVNYQRLVGR